MSFTNTYWDTFADNIDPTIHFYPDCGLLKMLLMLITNNVVLFFILYYTFFWQGISTNIYHFLHLI